MIGNANGYVASAVNWVMGGNTTGNNLEQPSDSSKPVTGISSSTVNQIMPNQPIDLNMDDIESFGTKPTQKADTPASPIKASWDEPKKTTSGWDDWGNDDLDEEEAPAPAEVKPSIENMGGWGKDDNLFSDEEENDEEKKKEDANLALIQQMAKKKDEPTVKKTSELTSTPLKINKSAKATAMNLDDWAVSLMDEEKKTARSSRSTRIVKDSSSKTGWDDDLFGEPSKPVKSTKKDDWDDWDDKPATSAALSEPQKSSNDGWDDWDDKPAVSKKDDWDDWDDKPKKTVDDWDDKPIKRADTRDIKPVKKVDDWDMDVNITKSTNDGWDDWDAKPSKPTKKSDDWDDWDAKPSKSSKKSDGWDDW